MSEALEKRVLYWDIPNHVSKNRGLITNPDIWRVLPRLAGGFLRPNRGANVTETRFVATHHRVMTTYFSAVLRLLAISTNSHFAKQKINGEAVPNTLLLSMHGNIDFAAISPYRGIHIMRDPRDVIVSSYHYHKWTHEPWAHVRDANGMSYQQKLNDMSIDEGLILEADHFALTYEKLLREWDLEDPNILELRFEDLVAPGRELIYPKMFEHLGFSEKDVSVGCKLMRAFQAENRSGRTTGESRERSHIRNSRSGEWRDVLSSAQVAHLEDKLGAIIDKFGYRSPASS